MLEDGVIELGQVLWPHFTAGPDFEALACFCEPLLFVASPQHPLARKSAVQMQDIVEQGRPFFHLGSGQVYRHIVAQIRALDLPNVDVPLSTSDRLLRQGIGVGCYTRTLVADDLTAGRLVELCIADALSDYRQIAFVRYRRKRPLSSAAQNFIAQFQETVSEMDQSVILEAPI
jgi:DNA-binding transcriptional LysR family regulator